MWRRLFLVFSIVFCATTASAAAAPPEHGFTFRAGGPLHVGPAEQLDSAIVMGGDADVQGRVRDTLVVVKGNARIAGDIGEVSAIQSTVELLPGSHVQHVSLIEGAVNRHEGAVVGSIEESSMAALATAGRLVGFLTWVSATCCMATSRSKIASPAFA